MFFFEKKTREPPKLGYACFGEPLYTKKNAARIINTKLKFEWRAQQTCLVSHDTILHAKTQFAHYLRANCVVTHHNT